MTFHTQVKRDDLINYPKPLHEFNADKESITRVIYAPHGWTPETRLGDYVIQQPVALGLKARYPKADITVVSGSKTPYNNIPGINAVTSVSDPQEEVRELTGNSILLGRFEVNDDVIQVSKRGGMVLKLSGDFMWAFSGRMDGKSASFPYDKSYRLMSILDDNKVSYPSVPLTVRAEAFDAGINTPRYPNLVPDPGHVKTWSGWLDENTSTGSRTFYNALGISEAYMAFTPDEDAQIIAGISGSSDIVLNPGREGSGLAQGKVIMEKAGSFGGGENLHISDKNIDQDELLAIMAGCDIVLTRNTGVMHAAAGLNRPYVLGYFENVKNIRTWLPENPTCFGIVKDVDAMIQGHNALTLLAGEGGLEVFKEHDRALSEAREYVGLFTCLDPVKEMYVSVDREKANSLLKRISGNVREDYAKFLMPFDEPDLFLHYPPHWHPHTQQTLYRYCYNIMKLRGERVPAEKMLPPIEI